MRLKYICYFIIPLLLIGCDDNTGNLGANILPDEDNITTKVEYYKAVSQSILAENIYARTSTAFLGKYTDKDFGAFEADFLSQFNCTDSAFKYPVEYLVPDAPIKAELVLSYPKKGGFFGDSLNTMHLSVYELNKVIEDDPEIYYYTDIDPKEYYDLNSQPIGEKVYSAKDPAIRDSIWNLSSFVNAAVTIPLKDEVAKRIFNLYQTNPEYFENAETFKQNVFKGVYVTSDHGDGTILYLDRVILYLMTDMYHVTDSTGVTDSILYNREFAEFATTKEVVQANRFRNSEEINKWVEDKAHTYFKTPAGIFTEVTLPIADIENSNPIDSINAASIVFQYYNSVSTGSKSFEMAPPEYILMVRKKDMYTFFEKNQLPDNYTSYLIQRESSKNQYSFPNISRLIVTCLVEKDRDPDWDKVVLIPVTPTYNASGTLTTIRHDLKLTSAKLLGGIEGEQIQMTVIFSSLK